MTSSNGNIFRVTGIHRLPVNSPHKGQWRGALVFTLICPWTNSWSNNEDASDLRHHRAHYDATVMDDRRHNQMHSDKQNGSWTKWPIFCCRLLKWDPFNRIFCIFTKISLRFVRRCAIENTCKSRCVKIEIQIEDFFIYRPGDKQLTEQLVKQSVGAYMHK